MNIIVVITTFNRSEELEFTFENLFKEKDFLENNNVTFEVYDDRSNEPHLSKNRQLCKKYGAIHFTSVKTFGKEGFWRIHKAVFNRLSKKQFDYVFSLQDDFSYAENFFTNTLNIFKKVEKNDNRVACLNLRDDRINKIVTWTNLKSKLININGIELYKVGWVDCIYLANKKFFEILKYNILPVNKDRWKKRPKKSSGVGEGISKRIVYSGYNIYQLKKPLVKHTKLNDSKMHEWRNEL